MNRILVLALTAGALALPAAGEQLVRYELRADPSDPGSEVEWTIDIELTAVAAWGSQVGWQVERIEIRRLDEAGEAVGRWLDSAPQVNSPDGLWWVAHADPLAPNHTEFRVAPPIGGVGGALDSDLVPLVYAFEAVGLPNDPNLASISCTLIFVGWVEPLRGGEIEWVDVPWELDPPMG